MERALRFFDSLTDAQLISLERVANTQNQQPSGSSDAGVSPLPPPRARRNSRLFPNTSAVAFGSNSIPNRINRSLEASTAHAGNNFIRLTADAFAQAVFRTANITDENIKKTLHKVLINPNSSAVVDHLSQSMPWVEAMQRSNPKRYQPASDYNEFRRAAIACCPPRMSEQEWIDAFKKQKTKEKADVLEITKQLTRAVLHQCQFAQE